MDFRYKAIIFSVLALVLTTAAGAQSFRKGSLLISLSEGNTYATFTTTNAAAGNDVIASGTVAGARDPLTIEYGLTNHWGLGLNMGGDIYKVDPSKFYNFKTSSGSVKTITSETTLDANYHFFNTRHTDLAAFASLGFSSVTISGDDGDHAYKYNAGGMIVRTGTKAKYYITRRFGVMGMASIFAMQCSTWGIKGNTVGQSCTTTLTGTAVEFGLCYRVLR